MCERRRVTVRTVRAALLSLGFADWRKCFANSMHGGKT
jgi:hypothetical protein